MPSFRVKWEIDIEANTPLEAARQALEIQRDPESLALGFDIYNSTNEGDELVCSIDLENVHG